MYPAYDVAEVVTNPYSNIASTRDTILIMRKLVTESLPTPQVALVAESISRCLGRSPHIEDVCRKVFWWIKSNIRLVEDEWTLVDKLGHDRNELLSGSGVELLLSPAYLLLQDKNSRQGDCDDFSTLAATLLIRIGIPRGNVYFCTIAANAESPNEFTHVYVKIRKEDGSLIPFDSSHGPYPGWETKEKYNEMLWPA